MNRRANFLEAKAAEPEGTPHLHKQREQLHAAYGAYAAEYGPLNWYEVRRTGRFEADLAPFTGETVGD